MSDRKRTPVNGTFGRSASLTERVDMVTHGEAEMTPEMALALNALNQQTMTLDAVKFTTSETGIQIVGLVTERDVVEKIREIVTVQKSDFWGIGDLLVFVEDNKWDSIYNEVAAITGKSVKTLQNYAWLSRAIHNSLRGEKGMTAKHYKLIAPFKLGEQKRFIKRVQENNWSTAQLEADIKGGLIPPTPSRLSDLGEGKVYVQSAKKLAQHASGVGGFTDDEIRAAIEQQRQWLDDLERNL